MDEVVLLLPLLAISSCYYTQLGSVYKIRPPTYICKYIPCATDKNHRRFRNYAKHRATPRFARQTSRMKHRRGRKTPDNYFDFHSFPVRLNRIERIAILLLEESLTRVTGAVSRLSLSPAVKTERVIVFSITPATLPVKARPDSRVSS